MNQYIVVLGLKNVVPLFGPNVKQKSFFFFS